MGESDITGKDDLATLLDEIRACRACVEAPIRASLPHRPRPVVQASSTARLCIAGQAPGTRVHATGIPFNDPSGDRLRDWLGVGREVFYDPCRLAIVPMGFCFPGLDAKGGDLPPRRECRALWHDRLYEAMPQVELVLAIGQYAQAYHLGADRKRNLTETVGHWRQIFAGERRPRILPLPHPSWRNNAWLKRNPWFETDLLPVLRAEVARLIDIKARHQDPKQADRTVETGFTVNRDLRSKG
ncbi:uracil-DNA glycosylase family protein [Breoghania sp. L-A4]|uniref:uracil-DNA glycosylase family protein n=1 Tax=Breoghania sp. L-A4 TaxID=2304600 RepID=UPI000E3583A6|nr:uracil-DNA glycosylase family protein [Breoghania sp. L-A4]AXS40109.1 uracil-DNA glycosylase family protein [Breoghania sp. L-A4]